MPASRNPASLNYDDMLAIARQATGTTQTAITALQCLDLTSLNKDDTADTINRLVAKGRTVTEADIAAICVYPEFVAKARQAGANNIATVINFPLGTHVTAGTKYDDDQVTEKATPGNTQAAVRDAIDDGAGEVDIVLDYAGFQAGSTQGPMALLRAADDACYDAGDRRIPLKVILESAAFPDNESLYNACLQIAKDIRPEFLKTSTGKHSGGGATLEAGATLMDAASQFDTVGVKISGGVKTNAHCAQYIALALHMFATNDITPARLRFGASGVLDDLLATLCNDDNAAKIGT